MTYCSFDKRTNKLLFTIKQYTHTPKIVRYVQSNYVRTPIYEDLEKRFILSIIEKISIIPEWRKKEIELEKILNLINATKRRKRFSFIGYNSKKQASLNKQTNKDNREWNARHKIKIDQENSLLSKEIESEQFSRYSFDKKSQGIVAFISDYDYVSLSYLLSRQPQREFPLIILLDGIGDPHNFVPVNSTVVKVSIGGVAHVLVCQ
ncbi:15813_t:CDS:2, partial [Funneliformis caledonium]